MIKLQNEGKLNVLTVNKAKELRGKKIQTLIFGYARQNHTDEFTVGEILSEYELAKRSNQAECWECFMSPQILERMKEVVVLLNDKGLNIYTAHSHSPSEDYYGQFHIGYITRLVWYLEA